MSKFSYTNTPVAPSMFSRHAQRESHGANVPFCATNNVQLLWRQNASKVVPQHVGRGDKRCARRVVQYAQSLRHGPVSSDAESRAKRFGHSALGGRSDFLPAHAHRLACSAEQPGCFGVEHAREARQRQRHCGDDGRVAWLSRRRTFLFFSDRKTRFRTRALSLQWRRAWGF